MPILPRTVLHRYKATISIESLSCNPSFCMTFSMKKCALQLKAYCTIYGILCDSCLDIIESSIEAGRGLSKYLNCAIVVRRSPADLLAETIVMSMQTQETLPRCRPMVGWSPRPRPSVAVCSVHPFRLLLDCELWWITCLCIHRIPQKGPQ